MDARRPLDGPVTLKVWIDQDLCTGDGLCTDHAPDVFMILDDGIAYCREGDRTFNDPGGSAELATVPRHREKDVIDAAAECPGECIFVEIEEMAGELEPSGRSRQESGRSRR
jgi:ferredoxin